MEDWGPGRHDNLTYGAVDTASSSDPDLSRKTGEPPLDDFQRALTVLRYLHTFFIPLLIVLGLVGNGLSFVTFLFTRLKVRASSFYLGTLALSDFGYLFLMSFVWIDKQGFKTLNQRGVCQVILFLSSAFSFWSVWLTVSFTAERCVAVQCPVWRLQLSTRSRAKVTVATTAIASLLLNAYLLVLTDVIVEDGVAECEPRPEFEQILHYTNIMDTIVTLIVPFILIVVMNFMIGRTLYLYNSRRRMQGMSDSPDTGRATWSAGSASEINRNLPPTAGPFTNGAVYCHTRDRFLMHPSQISVSRMLFLVCTVFIILNLPSYVVRIHVFLLSVSDQPVPEHVYLLQRYFMLLYYTNFAVNFILYNAGSRIFRRMMKQYVWSKWRALNGVCRSTESLECVELGAGKRNGCVLPQPPVYNKS